jgi:hypothetical protein
MESGIKAICDNFSKGNFKEIYPYFTDDIEWYIIGDRTLKGKVAVVDFCDTMLVEMASSVLKNTNVIADANSIAIEGFCTYTNKEGNPEQLNYCDTYLFEEEKIKAITSYCIPVNKK